MSTWMALGRSRWPRWLRGWAGKTRTGIGVGLRLSRWGGLAGRFGDGRVRVATERFVLGVLLPAWLIPGALDWVMHKRTRIEDTSGTRESALHALMMTEVGAPVVLGLLLEITPPVLLTMMANLVAHEATAFWDVRTAYAGGREVRPNEQHIHSFLEVLPFAAVAFLGCLHPEAVRGLFGLRGGARWRLRLKRPGLAPSYLAGIGAAIAALLALPYAEELARCRRAAPRLRLARLGAAEAARIYGPWSGVIEVRRA
jgi:hypothetical protein